MLRLIAAVFCASYSMVVTFAMLKALDLVVPLKPPAEGSLDQHEHGEQVGRSACLCTSVLNTGFRPRS